MEAVDTLSTYGASAFATVAELSTLTIVAVGVCVVLFIAALRLGKEILVSLILALYIGYLAQSVFPYYDALFSLGSEMIIRSVVLSLLTVGAFLVIRRVMWVDFTEGGAKWLDAGLLSIAATFLLAAIVYAIFPTLETPLISTSITAWLSNPTFLFFWILAPLGAIFVASRQ